MRTPYSFTFPLTAAALLTFSFLISLQSHAQIVALPTCTPTATATPYIDPHPFQSQTWFRLKKTPTSSGTVGILPAVTVDQYTYKKPGNSVTQVEKNTMFLYDKMNPFPTVTVTGGNYSFFEGNTFATISADGFLFYKGKTDFMPKTIGGMYFIDQNDELIVIDSSGFYIDTFSKVTDVKMIGGNFFIDHQGVLTTMKASGTEPGNSVGMVTKKDGKDFSDAIRVGGNFFVRASGNIVTIVTISAITGFYDEYTPESTPLFVGGNYFIGVDRFIYTVGADGILKKNEEAGKVYGTPKLFGYSYFVNEDDTFVIVDGMGVTHKSFAHVSTTGSQSQIDHVFPQGIDANTVYLNR